MSRWRLSAASSAPSRCKETRSAQARSSRKLQGNDSRSSNDAPIDRLGLSSSPFHLRDRPRAGQHLAGPDRAPQAAAHAGVDTGLPGLPARQLRCLHHAGAGGSAWYTGEEVLPAGRKGSARHCRRSEERRRDLRAAHARRLRHPSGSRTQRSAATRIPHTSAERIPRPGADHTAARHASVDELRYRRPYPGAPQPSATGLSNADRCPLRRPAGSRATGRGFRKLHIDGARRFACTGHGSETSPSYARRCSCSS